MKQRIVHHLVLKLFMPVTLDQISGSLKSCRKWVILLKQDPLEEGGLVSLSRLAKSQRRRQRMKQAGVETHSIVSLRCMVTPSHDNNPIKRRDSPSGLNHSAGAKQPNKLIELIEKGNLSLKDFETNTASDSGWLYCRDACYPFICLYPNCVHVPNACIHWSKDIETFLMTLHKAILWASWLRWWYNG